jgi:HEPN domain-containing protein
VVSKDIISEMTLRLVRAFNAERAWLFGSERHLDTGVYHCQQAIEKALKALFRYPSELLEPSQEDIEAAHSTASQVLAFVKALLDVNIHRKNGV